MFLLRSAFWLTVAFVVIAPKDADLGAIAGSASAHAMAAGQQVIARQILEHDCNSLECVGAKAIAAAVISDLPSNDPSMQDSSISPVPIPRPRPDWMG